MPSELTILVVEDDDAVAELFARIVTTGLPGTTLIHVRSGREAIARLGTGQVDLVLLDMNLPGSMSGREICLKLRALQPTVPILPCSVDVAAAPFLADLGCAPLVAKQQVAANPYSLLAHINNACQQAPVMRVPPAAFSYMLERADAALADELRQQQAGVIVLCRHPLLRTGLTRALAALGVPLVAVASGGEELLHYAESAITGTLIMGPVTDVAMLQMVGRMLRLPVLGVVLHRHDLNSVQYSQLAGTSLLLYDNAGDTTQLLNAIHTVAQGQPFLALPSSVLARWVPALAGLTTREWEMVIASLLSTSQDEVAATCGITVASVETYWKRVRRRLAPHSQQAILQLARNQLTTHLGIMPVAPSPPLNARSLGQAL
mgnify:CR=1 FL=1